MVVQKTKRGRFLTLSRIKTKHVDPNEKMSQKESLGKKKANEGSSARLHTEEIYAFMDSDCDMAIDATEKAVQIFYGDKQIKRPATGHGRVKNRHAGGFRDHFFSLEKIQGCLCRWGL